MCKLISNPQLQHLLNYVVCTINGSVIPLIFALAVVVFVWGVVQYVINSDEEAKKEKGRQFMIWGIIGLTVMLGVWGLVAILGNTFGLETEFLPQVHSPSSPDTNQPTPSQGSNTSSDQNYGGYLPPP